MNQSLNKRVWWYNTYVFVSGAAVMLLEFAASRLLAPFFGSSIFVWGNIIGVVLIALSLGYYLGGKLADRHPNLETISKYVLFASAFTAVIPWLVSLVVQPLSLLQTVFSTKIIFSIVGSFGVIVLLFAIPIFLLGMVSPFLIRIAFDTVSSTGRVAGSLYAWSTLGSILGTFGGAFVIVPLLGSRESILLSSVLLAIIGVIGSRRYWYVTVLLLPLGMLVWLYLVPLRADAAVLEQGETYYQYYTVTDVGDRLLLQYNEGLGTQSFYMKEGVLTGNYYDYVAQAPKLQGHPQQGSALVLGLAGGTLTRQLTTFFPNWNITGVEIDGEIVEVAKHYFHLADQPIEIVIDDGRNYLQATDQKFDLIFIDVFTNEYYIPWHMTTREFVQTLSDHQPADGMVALNIGSVNQDTVLFKAMLNTLHTMYPNIYIVPVPESLNYAVFASKRAISMDAQQYVVDDTIPVLTDNRAPVELYTESMIWNYIVHL